MFDGLPKLEEIGYDFKKKELLLEALTHRSYSVEKGFNYDNQRLEFLGDAVIQIIITDYLFARYPMHDEGLLTKMRSALNQQSTLANFAKNISLGSFLKLGKGESKAKGNDRNSTLCDAFEALAGAIYLDGGMDSARNFLVPLIDDLYPSPELLLQIANPKGYLQEYTQKKWGTKPLYKIEETSGPEHQKSFSVSVTVNNLLVGNGTASSRKSAESMAAESAMRNLADSQAPDPKSESIGLTP
ncbi:MAG TPA: ribonuclease III [Lentisphaeria bacterium]|nr:MAG: ribonuclease III [Lentisphaerae bacterium GWF2_50_93]HCE46111.1 ribonuclease III [Lentisphaeria bacterium]